MNGQIRYFSMFTGVGGFELGFERENNRQKETAESTSSKFDSENIEIGGRKRKHFVCIGISEIDKYASKLLADKFPDIKNYGDATKINTSELPDFELLCGGFPCQAFSIAGKRKGFEDTRGTLFHEIYRIAKAKRPKYLFLENVKGLLSHDNGRTFATILATLSELGYVIQWMVLNSKFFGVPQNRERVFIIGSFGKEPIPEILPFRQDNSEITEQHSSEVSNTITQRYYKQGNADTYVIHNIYGGFGEGIRKQEETVPTIRTPKGGGHLPMIDEKTRDVGVAIEKAKSLSLETGKPVQLDLMHLQHGELRPLSTYIPQDFDTHRAIQAGEPKEVLVQGTRIRRLTPTECERLQGFPDGWTSKFSDTQRYKMMGNAVTVNVISAIAKRFFNE